MPTIGGCADVLYSRSPEGLLQPSVWPKTTASSITLSEQCVREDLNKTAQRVMAVLAAEGGHYKLPEGRLRSSTENNPEDSMPEPVASFHGSSIERDDFSGGSAPKVLPSRPDGGQTEKAPISSGVKKR